MRDRWNRIGRLLSALATKRGVILTLVVVVGALGAGLAIFQGDPVDDSSTVEEATTTEVPYGGPTENTTVDSEETESTSSQRSEDDEAKADGRTPPQTQGDGVPEETTQTTSETTRTTSEDTEITRTTTSDEDPDVNVSGESNASASSLTRVAFSREIRL